MPHAADDFDPAAVAGLPSSALIKQINALAEEAGGILEGAGLALGPPEAVLKAAAQAGIRTAAQDRLARIFAEIAGLKTLLARRRAGG